MSKDFQKNSEKLETMMINQNFWMCSRKCIAMFVVLGLLLIIIWNLIGSGSSSSETETSGSTTETDAISEPVE